MDTISRIAGVYLGDSLLLLLLTGSVIALAVGLIFLLKPSVGLALNRWFDRRYSLRRTLRPLETSHSFEPVVYRHHRIVGLFLVIGTCYVLYQLGFNYHHQISAKALAGPLLSYPIADWLLTALLWFSVPAMLLILLFGALLATRPSSLKGIEQSSNRWVSTRRWLHPLETSYEGMNVLVQRYPRSYGFIVVLLSCYSLAVLFIIYLSKHA